MNKEIGISPVVAEGNRVLAAAIKHFGLTVPPEKIILTIQSKGRKNALGWFWSDSWKLKKESYHEINLSAEHLHEHNMGETLLHELAHAENCHCNIQDCDKTGRRHNKKFKVMAEKLGLTVAKAGSLGWAFTDLAEPGKQFLDGINFDRSIFEMFRKGATKGKQGTRLLKCECPECGYVVRTTQKWLDVGVPSCPCGAEMVVGS
jgi:hypothetical protein